MSIADKMKDQLLSLDIPVPPNPLLNGIANHVDTELGNDVVCWLLDTRTLWPGKNITTASSTAYPLSLVTAEEQQNIKQKMFIADAKMSLASALLKRLFISKSLGIPWSQIRLGRRGDPKHGKPCAADNHGRPIEGIDFNVSHQNGLVALIGWNGNRNHTYNPIIHSTNILSSGHSRGADVTVGIDIVCVDERKAASSTIELEGFGGWVDVYESVFSAKERNDMKFDVDAVNLPNGSRVEGSELGAHRRSMARHQNISLTTPAGNDVSFSSELLLEAKLRRFYAYFCYKEAYIKLSGEALLAPWLKELEFFNVRSPRPNSDPSYSSGKWGEEVDDVEVKFRGRAVENVKMKIQAFEDVFMISSAVEGDVKSLEIPPIQSLHLEKDVLDHATSNLATTSPELIMTPWEARYF